MARVTCSLQFVLVLAAALLTLSATRAEASAAQRPRRLLPGGRHPRCPRRQIGPAVPDWMVKKAYPAGGDRGAERRRNGSEKVDRRASGTVLICVQGNAPQCDKASTSKTPTKAMQDYCASTPNAEVIPLYVIGHENPMIYDWGCRGKEPTIKSQVFNVDAQGYPAELWQTVTH